jgi:hypothetical protein
MQPHPSPVEVVNGPSPKCPKTGSSRLGLHGDLTRPRDRVMNLQLEPARIESLLDHAWRLVSQLRQWFAASSLGSKDQDGLVELIRNLQLLWVKADDLGLKRLARSTLAIEQFLERFCAGKLELTSENLNDVTAAVATLQDLLLGLEAMREEPVITDLESLQKLERGTLKGFGSDKSNRTIEVTHVANDVTRLTDTVDPRSLLLEVTPTQSHPRLTSEKMLHGLTPIDGHRSDATGAWPAAMRHLISVRNIHDAPHFIRIADNSNVDASLDATIQAGLETPAVQDPADEGIELRPVLILEDSLFYRNLIGMALRSVGFDSDSIKSDTNALETILNERSSDYCAILVGEPVTPAVADAIVQYRDANGVIVIALTAAISDEPFPFEVDGSVSKSNPRDLILLLNSLLNPTSGAVPSSLELGFEPSASARDVERRVG